ncbi:MAG TPA: ABC transporter permease [Terriglobales bacterium]|jgi:predicted permease
MRNLRAWCLRLAGIFQRDRRDRELAEEIDSHIQMHVEENLRAGMSQEEARRQALLKFGSIEAVKEEYRDRRGLPTLELLAQDLRYGARMLRKNPSFTIIAILTLALGIGANTVIFNIVNSAILRPLPFPNADRLVSLYWRTPQFGNSSVPYPNFLDWQHDNRTFRSMAMWRQDNFNLTGSGEAQRIAGMMISASFFDVLGIQPVKGRTFTSQEDQLGVGPVVLVSERMWKTRFGSSPEILGQVLTLNGRPHSVVGVVPASLRIDRENDVFVPIGQWTDPLFRDRKIGMGTRVIGELKPGFTLKQAAADMDAIALNLAKAYPDADAGTGVNLLPLKDDMVGDLRPVLLVLLGAVGFVLLIACVNVANLLLARSTGRTREFAVRAALGASRARVIRQLLTESVLLALMGGVIGAALATWGTQPALALLPSALPLVVHVDLDARVLVFAIAVSMLTGILFGLAPAWKTSDPNLQEALKEGGRGVVTARHRAQSVFIVTEVALALILLIGAGLMIRSLSHLWKVDPGFDPHNVLTFEVGLPSSDKPDPEAVRQRDRMLSEKLSTIPGVDSASVMLGSLPMSGDSELPFWMDGQPKPASDSEMSWSLFYGVGADYFKTMRIPLMRGRLISERDTINSPLVIVIDETFAKTYFPGQDPVGKRINLLIFGSAEIVGVVGHIRHWGLDGGVNQKIQSELYLSYLQIPDAVMPSVSDFVQVVLRSSRSMADVMGAVRREISSLDNRQVIYGVQWMDEIVSDSLAQRRFSMLLLSIFALIALLLATIGIYGVISYLATQRTHEIGIRMALGAQPRDILQIILGQGGRMALLGILLGVLVSFGLTRLIQKLLFDVSATDPITFGLVASLLLLVTLAACCIPARRAMKVDPMVALRYE